MNNQENIDNRQQMMCIPEGIEPSQVKEWPGQLDNVPSKRVSCQCKGKGHKNDHENSSHSHYAINQIYITWLAVVEVWTKPLYE